MAQNLAAKLAEKALGHGDHQRAATTDVSNPARQGGKYADESGERMKALVWMGKNDVRVRRACLYFSDLLPTCVFHLPNYSTVLTPTNQSKPPSPKSSTTTT